MSVPTSQRRATPATTTHRRSPLRAVAHAVYSFFYNKRVGLGIILAASLLTLCGVLFPQTPAGVREDPVSYHTWLGSVRTTFGGWTSVLEFLGFFHVFSSVVFLVVMAALAVSILACTSHRIPLLRRSAFRPRTKVTEAFLERARYRRSFTTELPPERVMAAITTSAKRRRMRTIADDRGPGDNLYTDQWHWAPFGTVMAHVAMVITMLGFLVSSLVGFRDDQFTLTIGEPTPVGHDTGWTITATSFADTYYDNGQPKDYVSHLVLSANGTMLAEQDARVNEPLSYDGVMFHQAYFGVSAVVGVADANGKIVFRGGVPMEWNTPDKTMSYGAVDLPGTGKELYVIGPASGSQGSGIDAGQVRVEIYPAGQNSPLGVDTVDQGGSKKVDAYTITFERETPYTGLIVKKDPGTWVVWLGFALLTIGTCVTMLLRHHRVWFRVTVTDDGSRVQMASTDRTDAIFERRFNQWGAALESDLEA